MKKKVLYILFILSALSLTAHVCLIPRMPEIVPTHWDINGTVNGYSHRYTTILLAALPLLMLVLLRVLPKLDPKGRNYEKHQNAYAFFCILITLLLIAVTWISDAAIFGLPVSMERIVPVLVGILLLTTGNFMPQIRQNYTFGIKTPWTLENEQVWRKTHQAGGIVFCIYGILMILCGIFPLDLFMYVFVTVLILGIIGLYGYSWLLYRQVREGRDL